MTRILTHIASAICIAAALVLVQGQTVAAQDARPGATTVKKVEVSKRHKHRTARAVTAPTARSGWTGPDPTKGGASDYMRQMQREGRCFFDEGYGRYTACSNE